MKTLTLVCGRCKTSRKFVGTDVDDIIRQIDEVQWRDSPEPMDILCRSCDLAMEEKETQFRHKITESKLDKD